MNASDFGAAVSNSLSLSSILILAALGLAITFGVMRVINMAHGDLMMLGAYTALVVTDPRYLGLNLFVAIPAAFLVVAFVGFGIEVCLLRFLYGRPLDTLLATWGVGLILQQAVNLIFGANLQPMHLPEGWPATFHLSSWFSVQPFTLTGLVMVGNLAIPNYRIFIAGIALLCLLAVYLWFYKTSFGLKIRAVVQNRPMAAAMGISTRRVDALTFAFASGLAGIAGCILAHLYNTNYQMGNDYIVEAFMTVILGGMGNLSGSVASGAIIGTGDSFMSKLLGATWLQQATSSLGISPHTWEQMVVRNSEAMSSVLVLIIVITIIWFRPTGLFAAKERSYE
jgi:urea transport system permease protein